MEFGREGLWDIFIWFLGFNPCEDIWDIVGGNSNIQENYFDL